MTLAGLPVVTVRTNLGQYNAGATFEYKAVVYDQNGNVIPGSAASAFTLTVWCLETGALVNGIDHVNILNLGRGTLDNFGNVTVILSSADMAYVSGGTQPEHHVMQLELVFGTGPYEGVWEAGFTLNPIRFL